MSSTSRLASSFLRLFGSSTNSPSRSILNKFTNTPPRTFWQKPSFKQSVKMSSVGGVGTGAGLYAVVSTPAQIPAAPEDAKEKKHHLKNGKGFQNPWDSFLDLGFWDQIFKGIYVRRWKGESREPDRTAIDLPVQKPTFNTSRETPKLRATWLGHACYYVEFPSGLRVLFDPVFEPCCVPVAMKRFERITPVPCEIEDLPFVDAVVISHNHYDHLSYPTAQRIRKKFPEAHFFVPLGNKKWFEQVGVGKGKVTELDWWEASEVTLEPVKQIDVKKDSLTAAEGNVNEESTTSISASFSALPCQHGSARGAFDKNATLWASWSVESGGSKVYFAGDTGYRSVPRSIAEDPKIDDYSPEFSHLPVCPAFAQIGALCGPFDLGLIPIGAYEPRWMWSPVHADPKDAVNIFFDTQCKNALGIHWGTWVLTEEDIMEPPEKLKEACEWKGVEEGRFTVCGLGESREYQVGFIVIKHSDWETKI